MAWRAPSADEPRPRRRGPGGGVVAIVVLIAMCLLWWFFSGNGPGGPDGNSQRLAVPDTEVTGPSLPTSSPTIDLDTDAVRIDGYVAEPGDRVALNYRSGPPRCVGTLDTPQVFETDAAVTVTLTLVPPESPVGDCSDVSELHTVRIALDAPLEGRSLLDGSGPQPVRVRADATANE